MYSVQLLILNLSKRPIKDSSLRAGCHFQRSKLLNPSDTKGFRTTMDTKGEGGVGPTPLLSHNSLDLGT